MVHFCPLLQVCWQVCELEHDIDFPSLCSQAVVPLLQVISPQSPPRQVWKQLSALQSKDWQTAPLGHCCKQLWTEVLQTMEVHVLPLHCCSQRSNDDIFPHTIEHGCWSQPNWLHVPFLGVWSQADFSLAKVPLTDIKVINSRNGAIPQNQRNLNSAKIKLKQT